MIVAALDADPVFGREAREAGRVLARRFDAEGRTLVLANDEGSDTANAAATPESLARALGSVAALINRDEDVLILYTTSHGSPRAGLNFRDPARGAAIISPKQLAAMLDRTGIKNRLIILQACFSGQFVPVLAAPRTVVATAASSMKPSFGCSAGNDWTFFGHALINQAMRQPDTFARQFRRAFVTIIGWETASGIRSVEPANQRGQRCGRLAGGARCARTEDAGRAGRAAAFGTSALSECARSSARPRFVDSPFGHDGKVARLAGGLNWFSAVELLSVEGNKRVAAELVAVESIEKRFDERHGRAMGRR